MKIAADEKTDTPDMWIYKEIGKKLRRERRQRKLTQEKVAEEIGISVDRVRSMERGQYSINLVVLFCFCNFYQKNILYFLPDCEATRLPVDPIDEDELLYRELPSETKEHLNYLLRQLSGKDSGNL